MLQQLNKQVITERFSLFAEMKILELLKNTGVVIGNSTIVEEKLRKLVTDGPDNLQVIVDFDYTLTRAHKDGVNVDCSWGVLENYKELPSSYHTKVRAAKDKYYPIELDMSISVEDKIPVMIEWYKVANSCLAESGVQRSWLPKMVKESNCELRDDTDKMMEMLDDANIPVLVMSAGVGDLISEILKHFNLLKKNTSVVSNFLQFDDEGNILGLTGDMIHMYNKAEVIQKKSQEGDNNNGSRKNVIVMGDSLGDLEMAAGVKDPNLILTIGFLNKNIDTSLPKYRDSFDIVLVDDQSMKFPNTLLSDILSKS